MKPLSVNSLSPRPFRIISHGFTVAALAIWSGCPEGLDVRLPLERATSGLKELTDHGLVLRHAPLDQLWLPHMAGLLGNLGNETAPVHKAVSKYVHGLVPSTLCHRVLDTLSIPYRYAQDNRKPGGPLEG